MTEGPQEVLKLMALLEGLPGVREALVIPKSLDGVSPSDLSLPGEFGDLPQVAIMRTDGGRTGETLICCQLHFDRSADAMLTIEFLAWWVRDWARSGHMIQMRANALPPRAHEIQFGRTLNFLIEYFLINEGDDNSKLLETVGEMAESLESSIAEYEDCFDNPVDFEEEELGEISMDQLAQIAADDPEAAYQLGRAYAAGEGVDQSHEEAYRWYSTAAEQGHGLGSYMAGYYTRNGQGTEVNHALTLKYFTTAADAGVYFAFAGLGELYMEGLGIEKDMAAGFTWYEKGAAAGDAVCQAELGECFEYGKGVEIDLSKALELYQQSFAQGFEPVEAALQRVKAAIDVG